MRPRFLLLRRTLARKTQSPPYLLLTSSSSLRTFMQKSSSTPSSCSQSSPTPRVRRRPQNPYLSVTNTSLSRVRHMTTERKAQLKHDIKAGLKFVAYLYIGVGIVGLCSYLINQESLEKQFPTPREWSFLTRRAFRNACEEMYLANPETQIQWGVIIRWMAEVQGRLTSPQIDGQGVLELPPDRPILARDVSAKSEAWRRGYFESWMIMAKALEQVDGWMRDDKRDLIFPPEMVIGPSNPNPRPIPAGISGAPKEEDCTPAFKVTPNDFYLAILYTVGFSNKQRIEAGLAYASWLDFKGMAGPASIVYEEALNLALSEVSPETVVTETWTLKENAPSLPSENLLTTLTAYAEHRARNNDVSSALPIFISLLKARRSLPPDTSPPYRSQNYGMLNIVKDLLIPRPYPPPPPDGTSPPIRDPKELCAEAALSLHIGEIMYTSKESNHREEGLSWTREAVDIAEEQLHKLNPAVESHKPARISCRECLATGLSNWQTMVSRLAKEEAAKKEKAEKAGEKDSSNSSWFGLWGGKSTKEDLSRWAAEEKVIEERQRRAKDLIDDLEPPKTGWAVLLSM
ncbi:hypothetical protein V8F33_001165 [Rhypophila sp. PSN 637]